MLMVMLVLAIVAAVTVPMAVGTSDMQVISAARMISADLQYAQNKAITSQQQVTVSFDISGESYSLSNASGELIHPMTKKAYVVDFRSREGFNSLDIVSANFGGSPSVVFDELGAPDSSGSITLQAGPHVYQISVATATGKVTVTATNP
jgi:Tfp pilus assembly protein FimT